MDRRIVQRDVYGGFLDSCVLRPRLSVHNKPIDVQVHYGGKISTKKKLFIKFLFFEITIIVIFSKNTTLAVEYDRRREKYGIFVRDGLKTQVYIIICIYV